MSNRASVLLCSVVLILVGVAGCQKESPIKPQASATMELPRRLESQVEPLPPRETPAEAPKPAETPAAEAPTPAAEAPTPAAEAPSDEAEAPSPEAETPSGGTESPTQ